MFSPTTIDKNISIEAFSKSSENMKKLLRESWAQIFRDLIFPYIEVKPFEVLYNEKNSLIFTLPADTVAGLLILKDYLKLTNEEIIDNLNFDVRFQYAVYTFGLEVQPVDIDMFESFIRLADEYRVKSGINLIADLTLKLEYRVNRYLAVKLGNAKVDTAFKRFENLINLSTKLVTSAAKNDESFLSELLDIAMEQIPEADYGSVSVVEDGLWHFVDARGHDLELLKVIPLKEDHKHLPHQEEYLTYYGDGVILIDGILEKSQDSMPGSIFEQFAKASKPIKQSLIVELSFRGQYIGRIGLDIALEKDKCFSAESPKILQALGNMASVFLVFRRSHNLVDKLESVINLSGKLGSFALEKDESFLSELLDIAMTLIPEADYGSISLIEGDNWRFVDAKGHDIVLLKATPFKKDYFYDFNKDQDAPFLLEKDGNVVLVDYIVNNVEPKMPEEVHSIFEKASKPIRQSLIVQLNLNEEWAGHLGLDIAVDNKRSFTSESTRVLNAFGNIASAFMALQRLSVLQKDQQEQVNKRLRKTEEWNRILEQTVAERTVAVRNLLNNAGQGVLSFGEDLLVDDEYSAECVRIFGQEIRGRNFAELLYPNDREQQDFVENALRIVLNTKEKGRQGIYMSLLPEECSIGNKSIHIDYKLVSKAIMVILTDITEKRMLENRMEQERNTLKMVVKVVANYNSFIECIRDYQNFYENQMTKIIRNKISLKNAIFEIFRHIHTFKGNLGQFEMVNVVSKLHIFESKLSELLKRADCLTADDFKDFLSVYDMQSWLDLDMALLKGMLGEKFFNQDNLLMIDSNKIVDIENSLIRTLSPYECKVLLPQIRRLRYQPFKEHLRNYPEYVERLAERLEKTVYPVEIIGGDVLVDNDKYYGIAKALVHLFRNSLDHGLEYPEERISKGKDEYGSVRCTIYSDDKNIKITISDDGQGLNIDYIKACAVDSGLYNEEEINKLSKEVISSLIFLDGFSTKGEVSDMSGRGMGLAAVKNEVSKLGGSISVNSQADEGTEFHMVLPYSEASEIPQLDIAEIISPLIDTAQKFIMEHLNINMESFSIVSFERIQKLTLKNVTSFINVKGVLKGKFIMSMDEKLIRNIVRNFVMGQLTEAEEEEYMEDTMAECSNIILGNSIKMFPHIEELITIETPITMKCDNASIKYSESGIWSCNLLCESGSISISFLSSEIIL